MAPRFARTLTDTLRTEALLVKSVPVGDADLIATFFTECRGIVGTLARSARRSSRRFSGLEPVHLLRISIDQKVNRELAVLTEVSIAKPRLRLVSELDRLEAAGQALRWVRTAAAPGVAELSLWHDVNALLDSLDAVGPDAGETARSLLAKFGFRLLSLLGWGLDVSVSAQRARIQAMVREDQLLSPNEASAAVRLVDLALREHLGKA